MPVTTPTAPDRRQQSYQLVEKLKHERNQLWSLYCEFATLKPFNATEPVKKGLNKFSQLLVDYLSLGHFCVYERLLSGKERRDSLQIIATGLYPQLQATTEVAIAFNDKYEKQNNIDSFTDLERDMSILGESLAKRIDLEDQFCDLILKSDRRSMAR